MQSSELTLYEIKLLIAQDAAHRDGFVETAKALQQSLRELESTRNEELLYEELNNALG